MKRWTMVVWLLAIALVCLSAVPVHAQSDGPGGFSNPLLETDRPVVHALLFWRQTCPHCHEIRDRFLPPLLEKYGATLDIRQIELKDAADVDVFYALAEAYGIPRAKAGVPLLIVGQDALLGSDAIAQQFPSLIENYLNAGGAPWPSAAEQAGLHVSGGLESCNLNTPQACEGKLSASVSGTRDFILHGGGGLAAAMLLALGTTLALSVRRVVRKSWPVEMPGSGFLLFILLGLGVAGYLTYVEMKAVPAVCGPIGDCNAVQSSSYAKLFGFLPVALLGLLGYLAMGVVWGWARRCSPAWQRWISRFLWGMAVFGVGFSFYLTALEVFVLKAVCLWCLTSAALMIGCLACFGL